MKRLTNEQRTALRRFASAAGRRWKSALRIEWQNATCSSELIQVRNMIGPSGLAKIKTSEL